MKIWTKIVLPVLFLGLMTTQLSCIGDSGNNGNNNTNTSEGKAYFSLKLRTESGIGATRSVEPEGIKEERSVSRVHILLYEQGGENSKLLYNLNVTATTDGDTPFAGADVAISGGSGSFVSKGYEIEKRGYQMIVLVNASNEILKSAKAESDYPSGYSVLKDLTSAVSAKPSDFYTNETNGFFMSNAGGIIQLSESALKKTEAEAISDPVPVPVDRIVAKVLVYENTEDEIIEVEFGGDLKSVEWGLSATNKLTYLVRVQDKLKNGNSESGFYSARKDIYAKDPNFEKNGEIVGNDANKNKNFNYLSVTATTGFQPWIPYADRLKPAANYSYVLENTVSTGDQNAQNIDINSYVTHAVIKAVITEPGKGTNKLTGATDYYSYTYVKNNNPAWVVFTHKQAAEWYPDSYPADMQILKDNAVFAQAHAMPSTQFDFTDATNGAPDNFVATDFGLTYHKGGLNVYYVPIEHFGTDDALKGDYGYYGIVRNNIYKLIILSINGPGNPSNEEFFLSTKIQINEWVEREWEEDGLNPSH